MKPQTYSHRFSIGGLCATMTIFHEMFRNGKDGTIAINWNRRPTIEQWDAITPEYLAWKAEVVQAIANAAGGRVLEIVQVGPNDWLPREYAPEGNRV